MRKRFLLRDLKLFDINPWFLGERVYEPNEVCSPHHIRRYVLHFVTAGNGRVQINGQEYAVQKGDIFVCRPGYYASYASDAANPLAYIWIGFSCTSAFSSLLKCDVFSAPWAHSIFQNALATDQSAAPEWSICARLYDFFAVLAQQYLAPTSLPDDYVSRAVYFIQTNYPANIRIADIATDLGLSRNYFCRIFTKKMNLSPQEYLVSCRLNAAARLLTEEGLSQKEAASQVGYPDVYTFSRMFKRKYGMAPGEYVLQNRK